MGKKKREPKEEAALRSKRAVYGQIYVPHG